MQIANTSTILQYVDLSTIYGTTQAEQDSVRATIADGTLTGYGLLWPDVIASKRLSVRSSSLIIHVEEPTPNLSRCSR